MAGVIDEDGIQWEHCSQCTRWVKIDHLGYHETKGDLCIQCVQRMNTDEMMDVVPSKHWIPIYEEEE